MLEIIALIFLTKRIGNIVQMKGLSPTPYKALLVVLWFVGEIAGFFAFSAVERHIYDNETLFLVFFAVLGATIGSIIAFAAAKSAKPVLDQEDIDELRLAF